MNYLENLNCYSCFNLEFTKHLNKNQNINFDKILLFYLFYEALLKTCMKINIDMTIPKLDLYYSTNKKKKKLKSIYESSLK